MQCQGLELIVGNGEFLYVFHSGLREINFFIWRGYNVRGNSGLSEMKKILWREDSGSGHNGFREMLKGM